MKIITYTNVHQMLVAPIVPGLMWYFDLIKSALLPDRRFEEVQSPQVGLPFIFLPLAGYAQMTMMAGLGAPSLSRHGDKDAQIPEFRH